MSSQIADHDGQPDGLGPLRRVGFWLRTDGQMWVWLVLIVLVVAGFWDIKRTDDRFEREIDARTSAICQSGATNRAVLTAILDIAAARSTEPDAFDQLREPLRRADRAAAEECPADALERGREQISVISRRNGSQPP